MPFINDILKYKSLSIVGLEKNTGKTECLNYVLKNLPTSKKVCVTSIGLDGEKVDQVTNTSKPEIHIRKGLLFATSEKHYKERKVLSEIVAISDDTTSLGRVVTARALSNGKALISGPSSNGSLIRWMSHLQRLDVDLTIIDGALSKLSSASPAVSEAMILSTGAAYSANMSTLIQKTVFIVNMINLPLCDSFSQSNVLEISSLGVDKFDIGDECNVIKISGALTDRFLKQLSQEKRIRDIKIIIKDFTKIFFTPQTYHTFVKMGGRLSVEQRSKLIAVCVNPISPSGFVLNSDILCQELSKAISLPVYDIVKNKYEV
jgi:hypothetical protein